MKRFTQLALWALVAVGVVAVGAAAAAAVPGDLPRGGPPALHATPPTLPSPAGWPFGEHFPRTSGTGRQADGAYVWSDFLYDDNGAIGRPPPTNESAGAVSFGTYRYTREVEAGNGADLFRIGIGLARARTWWRVDWNTLVDAAVPMALFVMDTDGNAATGVADWPAGANVQSAGIDRALVISGSGAWLLDLITGERVPVADLGGTHEVDIEARSFVVSVPTSRLPASGIWTVRAGAGLADDDGEALLTLGLDHGALPGGANLFNVGFRDYEDEPAQNNFWMDRSQAQALTEGDVTPFSVEVDWNRLVRRYVEPEPRPTGWSNRWYVSSIELGQGRIQTEESTADDEPNYLGRVQPYGIHVPEAYDGSAPAPLTWVLHSFTINHNQYGATAPRTLDAACEQRVSICVTTLGRGPDGDYRDVAELDFWEVWHDVARHYALDPARTTVSGYSMGGFGTWRLAGMHPDLFAGMALLSAAASEDLPMAENLRHVPYYHDHGALDQLVPLPEAEETVARLDELGYRYRYDLHPAEGHVAYSLKDAWFQYAAWLAEDDRTVAAAPGAIDYTWFPADVVEELGIGPSGAWWLADLVARDGDAPTARVSARSLARPDPDLRPVRSDTVLADAEPSPALRRELDWEMDERPAPEPTVTILTRNTGRAALRTADAGLDPARPGAAVEIDTDGPMHLRLDQLPAGTAVLLDGEAVARASSSVDVPLPAGEHRITFATGPDAARDRPGGAPLPATGGGAAALAGMLALVGLLRGRRLR